MVVNLLAKVVIGLQEVNFQDVLVAVLHEVVIMVLQEVAIVNTQWTKILNRALED
jgi:hypothetical protein